MALVAHCLFNPLSFWLPKEALASYNAHCKYWVVREGQYLIKPTV